MAEVRESLGTAAARLSAEKATIAEKSRARRAVDATVAATMTKVAGAVCRPLAYLADEGLVFDGAAAEEARDGEDDDNGGGEPKKRCCGDRYDSSESSDSGVVVLSSTDCSSCSSSGCSGHSDITEPGSPYSSPGPCAAPGSPADDDDAFLRTGSESEDAPSPTAVDPRPPDPDWPPAFAEEDSNPRKRPYPWKGVQIANKRMRVEDEEAAPTPDNNNQTRRKQWAGGANSKVDAKGQIKITEYFKTQVKPKNGFKKELDVKLFPAQVKELLLDSKQQLKLIKSSIEEEEEDWSKNGASYVKSRTTAFIKGEAAAVVTEPPTDLLTTEAASNTVLDLANDVCVAETTSTINVIINEGSLELENKTESMTVAPLSPILSQPRVIRFPVVSRSTSADKSQVEVESVRCCWKDCQGEFICGSKLLDHLQSQHVNTQTNGESFKCMWVGCKVFDKTSCSRSWLERHVLTHGGSKPFKCIVEGCGQRFSTQTVLQRHVNGHFNSNGVANGNGAVRKSLESASNKLFKRNGKRLRLRRQPWSARMFDYMDAGKMEGVTYRLMTFTQQQVANTSNEEQLRQIESGRNLALRGEIVAKRTELDGNRKVLVHWHPEEILPDEWLKESEFSATKVVPLSSIPAAGAVQLHHSLLPTNNKVSRRPRKVQPKSRNNLLSS